MANRMSDSAASRSFAAIAARGSFVNTAQTMLNKIATAVAMLVIARFLSPADYGVAAQAMAAASFLIVLQPLTMGDVLIAHPTDLPNLAWTARRLATWIGAGTTLLILLSIPVFVGIYRDYPTAWLGGLLAVAALRPLMDARLVVPLARLRTELRYSKIAMIDGGVQLVVTTLAVIMAMTGLGGTALVVPVIIGAAARGFLYGRGMPAPSAVGLERKDAQKLMRSFVPASAAQYAHNINTMLEILILGYLAGEEQTGFFAFAFNIAAQANAIVAYQLGVVLQPIFGHLQQDPERQISGFLKVQRILALVCVPFSLLQAVLAEPLFRTLFAERFLPAIPVFQLISVAQAFYFASGPSMSCLRSQRRFATLLWWQGMQFVLSVPVYWFGALVGGAVGVAVASGCAWAISTPIAVWLCTRTGEHGRWRAALWVFGKPWLMSAPVFAIGWIAVSWLGTKGATGNWISLMLVGPLTLLVSLLIAWAADSELRELTGRAWIAVRARMGRRSFEAERREKE